MAGSAHEDRFCRLSTDITILNKAAAAPALTIDEYTPSFGILEPTMSDVWVTEALDLNIAEIVSGNYALYDLATSMSGKEHASPQIPRNLWTAQNGGMAFLYDQHTSPLIIDNFAAFNPTCRAFADANTHTFPVLNNTALNERIAASGDGYVASLICSNTALYYCAERIFRKNETSVSMIMNIACLDSWRSRDSTNAQANTATHNLTTIEQRVARRNFDKRTGRQEHTEPG
jgi:hypothetical protein